MTQPEATHSRAAIIADLACVVGELSELQTQQARLSERTAAMQSRLGKMIRDLSTTTPISRSPASSQTINDIRNAAREAAFAPVPVEAERPAAQAATPPDTSPEAQDEGQPVQVGKALDEAPERGVGKGKSAGQSEEIRHDAGAGGESAASADTAPAADGRRETMEEPRVPRRPPEVRNAGGGLVQDGGSKEQQPPQRSVKERTLDDYAATGDHSSEIAKRVGTTQNSVQVCISVARREKDPRTKVGDEKRNARLSGAEQLPLANSPKAAPVKAAVPPPPAPPPPPPPAATAAPAPAPKPAPTAASAPMPDGLLVRANLMDGCIQGPQGNWQTTDVMIRLIGSISSGELFGLDRMMKAGGIKKQQDLIELIPVMQAGLKKIGIDLVYTKGIGCRLRLLSAEVA